MIDQKTWRLKAVEQCPTVITLGNKPWQILTVISRQAQVKLELLEVLANWVFAKKNNKTLAIDLFLGAVVPREEPSGAK